MPIGPGGKQSDNGRSAGWLAHFRHLQQQVEDLERTLPMAGLRVLEVRIDDLERARERDAQSAADGGKLGLGFLARDQIERGSGDKMIQDRPQLDGFVDLLEPVDVLLHPFGDREIDRLDEVATICLRDGLATNEKIVDLTVDEIGVALEILFVDVEPRGRSEEALEPGYCP